MQTVDDTRLIQGLSLIRLAIAAAFLFTLATVAVPGLQTLMFLPGLAYLAGQILCLRGTGTVGKTSLLVALGTVGLGYGVTMFPESLNTIMVNLFGYGGLILLEVLGPLIQIASLIALLTYLSQVSKHYGASDLASHFRRLVFVLLALLAAPIYAALSMVQYYALWLGTVGAIAVVFIVSFSGALARLINAAMAKTQSG